MPRKFVSGDSKDVVVKQKVEPVQAKCQNCGKDMTIMSDYIGDILCPDCMKGGSYTLVKD